MKRRSNGVKIITGLIFNREEILEKAVSYLAKRLGPVDLESDIFPFNHTAYYNDEMGGGLKRRFLSFKYLKKIEGSYRLKFTTGKIEKRLSISGRRRINIDPGYLTLSKLVLLSTKDYSHRIHLKRGICAEVTLFFKDGSFHPWEWTYPDYKTKGYIDFFNRVREIYHKDRGGMQ